MPGITPFLWFDDQAEEAAAFYVTVFDDARITAVQRYAEGGPGEPGKVMTVNFELRGEPFVALNGGPQFPFTEAISFQIACADQVEVDHYWTALLADGGEESMCGWLKDRFGVSWQVVPDALFELISDPDPAAAQRATAAMLQMRKIDIDGLRRAAKGG